MHYRNRLNVFFLIVHQGTEPPEPAHNKPKTGENVESSRDLDPNDPDREREDGEVQVRPSLEN